MIQNLNCHVNAVSNYLYIILNHILCIIPGQSSDAFIPEQEVGDGDKNSDGNKNPPEESIQLELAKQKGLFFMFHVIMQQKNAVCLWKITE